MLSYGTAPILECSSRGDKRFSALYARIRRRGNKSIEELYQGMKLFPGMVQGLPFKEAKGKTAVNMAACREFYASLWDEYFRENPDLLEIIRNYQGFSDIFGQPGRACQAEEIFRIRNQLT